MMHEYLLGQQAFALRPEVLQEELCRILDRIQPQVLPTAPKLSYSYRRKGSEAVCLSQEELFLFWNLLGEELGIDLAMATDSQRQLLLKSCTGGEICPKNFGALLWLIYYSDEVYQ